MRLILVGLTTAFVVVLSVGTAGAHDDKGEMTVTKLEQTSPRTVSVEVGIVYSGDQHLAEDAGVTATLTGADGSTVGPVPLPLVSPESSLYGAEVQVPSPGTWSVSVASTEPASEATGTVEVTAEATSTTETPTTDAPATTTAPTDTAPIETVELADPNSSDNTMLLIGAGVVAIAIVAIVATVLRRRQDPADSAD